jgi:NADH dehydrogenase
MSGEPTHRAVAHSVPDAAERNPAAADPVQPREAGTEGIPGRAVTSPMRTGKQADAEREQRRWIRTLAIPFIAASVLMGGAVSGAGAWLFGLALVCGPGLGLAALLYLTFTSDTNGGAAIGERRHRVVVVGGGFAGVQAVRGLRRAPVEVTLVDRQNYTLFQPLVYQVATGALSPAEIAMPLRAILGRQPNARVLLGEVTGFDLERSAVVVDRLPNTEGEARLAYDTLIVAGGSHYSYFGHDEWQRYAPELKSLAGALEIRSRILAAFEAAEVEADSQRRRSWLTFVVVGGGPTGVEIAGQIAELAHDVLRRDFRRADTDTARVLLVESSARILHGFPESLSRKAAHALEQLGVTPLARHTVVDVSTDEVAIRNPEGKVEHVDTRTAIWAAGVTASDLAAKLAGKAGLDLDRAGRITVTPDLTLPGHPEVFALGDMVTVQRPDGTIAPLPGVAPVAMQEGRYAARAISNRLRKREPGPFRYRDKGNLATIGRSKAVADIKGMHLAGFPAWALWLLVHLFYLIGFQNRLLVVLRWTISFVTRGRGARLIVERLEGEARDGSAARQSRNPPLPAGS